MLENGRLLQLSGLIDSIEHFFYRVTTQGTPSIYLFGSHYFFNVNLHYGIEKDRLTSEKWQFKRRVSYELSLHIANNNF